MKFLNFPLSHRYVSCSECSYDSDACTCNSADRCYCSLGGANHGDLNVKLAGTKCRSSGSEGGLLNRSDSLPSCNSEDKCYCSLGGSIRSSTNSLTSCNSVGCASADKCYCVIQKDSNGCIIGGIDACAAAKNANTTTKTTTETIKSNKPNKPKRANNNLSLDYELFNSSNNASARHHVKPLEALSVKKTVEMAAEFADVKLSQTTDIKNLAKIEASNNSKNKIISSSKLHDKLEKISKDSGYSVRSSSSEVVLRREVNKRESEKTLLQMTKSDGYYQTIPPRPLSASLEDSLGYLP